VVASCWELGDQAEPTSAAAGSLVANVWYGLVSVVRWCRSALHQKETLVDLRLGIDIACRTAHQASLADHTGRLLWPGHRFHSITAELDRLWQRLPEGTDPTQVMVVMEPTRNAWVRLAAWFRRRGAWVILVPPQRSADLRADYHKHTKTDRLGGHPAGPATAAASRWAPTPSTAWAQPTRCADRPSCARPWSNGAPPPWPGETPCWSSWGPAG
jgi:transposase